MRSSLVAAHLLLVCLFCGCAIAGGGQTVAPEPAERQLRFTGQVVYVPLEGGFYGLKSDAGEKFDPVSLPAAFRRDGLRVRVTARLLPRSVGVHMWGAKIEIIAIENL
jgi:hypothetical protein